MPSTRSFTARAATLAALVLVCGCQSPPLPTPPPSRTYEMMTVVLEGCATPSVQVAIYGPGLEGPDPLHGSGADYVTTAELCFAIRLSRHGQTRAP